MCNRRAIRRHRACPLHVEVNPLPITRHVGEGIDHWLPDHDPIADADFVADEGFERIDRFNITCRHFQCSGGSSQFSTPLLCVPPTCSFSAFLADLQCLVENLLHCFVPSEHPH